MVNASDLQTSVIPFRPTICLKFSAHDSDQSRFFVFYSILPFLDLLSMVLRTCAVALTSLIRILLSGSASRGSAEEKNCPSRPTSVCCLFVFFSLQLWHRIKSTSLSASGPGLQVDLIESESSVIASSSMHHRWLAWYRLQKQHPTLDISLYVWFSRTSESESLVNPGLVPGPASGTFISHRTWRHGPSQDFSPLWTFAFESQLYRNHWLPPFFQSQDYIWVTKEIIKCIEY